ncbi:MAG: ankyrin repeat domain-containing protein [Flavobacterium sp.]
MNLSRLFHHIPVIFLLLAFIQLRAQQDFFSWIINGEVAKVESYIESIPEATNQLSKEGFSPLILASYTGSLELVRLLVTKGAAVNYNSSMGTALMAAIVKNHVTVVQFLLEKGADVNIWDERGTTPLIYAVQFKNKEVIKLLLNHKPDTSHTDKNGKTAFEYAVFSGDRDVIELLK